VLGISPTSISESRSIVPFLTATLPSSPRLPDHHLQKHLLSPESSPERHHKKIKETGIEAKEIKKPAAVAMSSDEEYIYEDDDGFGQDMEDQGKSASYAQATWIVADDQNPNQSLMYTMC